MKCMPIGAALGVLIGVVVGVVVATDGIPHAHFYPDPWNDIVFVFFTAYFGGFIGVGIAGIVLLCLLPLRWLRKRRCCE